MQVNVVVMKGINDDELADFVELTRKLPINVRFIEYMPFDGNVWSDSKMVTYADMMARVVAAFPQGLERFQVSNWSMYVQVTFDIQMLKCLWGSLSALSHHVGRIRDWSLSPQPSSCSHSKSCTIFLGHSRSS